MCLGIISFDANGHTVYHSGTKDAYQSTTVLLPHKTSVVFIIIALKFNKPAKDDPIGILYVSWIKHKLLLSLKQHDSPLKWHNFLAKFS